MGAEVARTVRNFNLENQAEWEISRMKPSPTPRHPFTKNLLKDDKLLSLLKDVYVDSQDPVSSLQDANSVSTSNYPGSTGAGPQQYRLLKDHQFDMVNVKNIPKGKISIVVVLTLLNNHKLYPDTWTDRKIAVEYHLEQQDVNSLLKYFVTFEVKNLPPKGKKAIRSK
ncbi:hypothetical protein JEQ12_019885 [Ovis aries]|uniref:NADH dehydrogenase [ubiquinone] 1 alpha subcomplex assembly factor 4 n=1 Tax=Ovis aries TaxID=9940 RepID=A0A836CQ61_SHEEP|nr:hypothetical protein JEQ12_019885 [Ovis aries]